MLSPHPQERQLIAFFPSRTFQFDSFNPSTSLNIVLNASFAFSRSIDSLMSAHSMLFTFFSFFSESSLNSSVSIFKAISFFSEYMSKSCLSLEILWSHALYISFMVLVMKATSSLIPISTAPFISVSGNIYMSSSLSTFSFASFITSELSALRARRACCVLAFFRRALTFSSTVLNLASTSGPPIPPLLYGELCPPSPG